MIGLSSDILLPMALLIIVPGVTGYLLYVYAIRKIEVSQTEACVMVEPIMAAIIGYLFFDEMLDWVQLTGALAILAGVFVYNNALAVVSGQGSAGLAGRVGSNDTDGTIGATKTAGSNDIPAKGLEERKERIDDRTEGSG
jgi:multidrug transporter EmrE-like cation transporter